MTSALIFYHVDFNSFEEGQTSDLLSVLGFKGHENNNNNTAH